MTGLLQSKAAITGIPFTESGPTNGFIYLEVQNFNPRVPPFVLITTNLSNPNWVNVTNVYSNVTTNRISANDWIWIVPITNYPHAFFLAEETSGG